MVGIIILNYNNSAQTLECVKTLRAHCTKGNWKLCVVDNASRTEEYAKLVGVFNDADLIRADVNGGYARGNDLGCEHFASDPEVDKILILNDDTRFTMDIITPMAEYLDTHAECGVVFPKVFALDGSIDPACMRLQKSTMDLVMQASALPRVLGFKRREFLPADADPRKAVVPPGSCMMLPKDLFQKIGWLDPGTFLYFEEHILVERLRRAGKTTALLNDLNIIHLGAQTTSKQASKAVYKHWRNSYLHFMKNYSSVPSMLQLWLRFRTWLKTLA